MGYNIILADDLANKEIRIGYEGENKTTKVVFTKSIKKCLETFGTSGTFTLACTNKDYPNGFPCIVTLNGEQLEWIVLNEQICVGYGSCQWTYTINGTDVEKSGKYTIKANDSIGSGSTPAPYTSWVATVEGYKNTCVEKAEEVEEALDDYTKTEDLSAVALSGSYNDLTNKPTIPDVTNYYTKTETNTLLGGKANSSDLTAHTSNSTVHVTANDKTTWNAKADTEDIPTKTSDLTNDSGFLTEHQSLSAYRTSADQDLIDETKASESDLTTLSGRVDTAEADIDDIEELIPSQATEQNQLADKNFVNSSIATETAHYISNNGEPFTSVAQLEAYSGVVTNNDYAFVSGTDEQGNAYYDRYKASVSGSTITWAKEYRLNNSSFTAQQWSAIQSGITANDVTKLGGIEANADVTDSANVKSAGATMGVKVAGTELTKDSDGKVNVPVASANDLGVSKPAEWFGTGVNASGYIYVRKATNQAINSKIDDYQPIVPHSLDYAILKGLESNSQIDTAQKKKAICNTIGAEYDGQFELIEEITLTEDTASIERTQTPNNINYNFKYAFVDLYVPTANYNTLAVCEINNNNAKYEINEAMSTTYPRCSYAYIDVSKGLSLGYTKSGNRYATTNCTLQSRQDTVSLISQITKIKVRGGSNTSFPSGTIIKIYGIWA